MQTNSSRISKMFGNKTFGINIMKEKLPKEVFDKIMALIEEGKPITKEVLNTVATLMKEWAIENGATHYTHWFQPLERGTAEKHRSFLSYDSFTEQKFIEYFDTEHLLQHEPDASSFPSGGVRSAFEARGYTIWDPTSPAFLLTSGDKATLCIPSIFLAYTGESLDYKTPLLRSIKKLSNKLRSLLILLGLKTDKIYCQVGAEQEFFLIDKKLFDMRPDLKLTGRTLIGAPSPKGQLLEDHYLGTIHEKILSFMQDLEEEAYSLGIPLHTRHNEVAPSQFEMVPIHCNANLANDHNKLLMEIMPRIARKHGLECLFYEKPFNGINGSGKHINFSFFTEDGKNILEPGETAEEQLIFLLMIVSITYAIYRRNTILRASIATPGNDLRLGGYEAPPAIISVYLGELITDILDSIIKGDIKSINVNGSELTIFGIEQIPALKKDYTDRNRTSPFAFTGQKFEFRAVGSSQSLATPLTYLYAAITEAIDIITKKLKDYLDRGIAKNEAIISVIKEFYQESKVIVFNGNNYSQEWVEEAERRGLPNIRYSFEALKVLKEQETIEFFEKYQILSRNELRARYLTSLKHLKSTIEIEANTLSLMVKKGVLPAAFRYLKELSSIDTSRSETLLGNTALNQIISKIDILTSSLYYQITELNQLLESMANEDNEKAVEIAVTKIRPLMEDIRKNADLLEQLVPEDLWPYPTYVEILH